MRFVCYLVELGQLLLIYPLDFFGGILQFAYCQSLVLVLMWHCICVLYPTFVGCMDDMASVGIGC